MMLKRIKFFKYLYTGLFILSFGPSSHGKDVEIQASKSNDVKFVQITDPHLFEDNGKEREERNSFIYFYLAIEKLNKVELNLKKNNEHPIDFVLMTGDLGIEKLMLLVPAEPDYDGFTVEKDGQRFKIIRNKEKWQKALVDLTNIIQDSEVKMWLFVPGNNDIYEDNPETIIFYEEFLQDLQKMPQIQKANLQIIDFRLESKQKINENLEPGVYKKGDLAFIGWDNSFFKNKGSLKSFLDHNNKPKPKEETLEYKRIMKLSNTLKGLKEKFAYIFLHIPEVDDPWLANFDVNDADEKNPVYKRFKKAEAESGELAKGLYPNSSWMVPDYIRQQWENLITNKTFKMPEIKGIFTGHFHDKNKNTYLGFHWLKSNDYNIEILNKIYVCPTVSIKNQLSYLMEEDSARGMQFVAIDSKNGKVKRKIIWFKH